MKTKKSYKQPVILVQAVTLEGPIASVSDSMNNWRMSEEDPVITNSSQVGAKKGPFSSEDDWQ